MSKQSKRADDSEAFKNSIDLIISANPGQTFDAAVAEYIARMTAQLKEELHSALASMRAKLFQLAGLLKHSSFQEEQEWRFTLPVTLNRLPTEDPIRYRARNNTLVPYIEFPISGILNGSEVLPLTNVIIGPGGFESAVDSVRGFLNSERLENVVIDRSQIPYRPW